MYVSPALQEASPVAPAQAGDTLDVTRCHQMALCSRGGWGAGWCVTAGKRPIDCGTVKYGRRVQKKSLSRSHKCKHFSHLADPLSAIPLPLTDLFSVMSDSPNHHTAELFILIRSGIQFKVSLQLNFLKMEFFLPHLPYTIETVTV